MKHKTVIDLGWANGWHGVPKQLQEATKAPASTTVRTDYNRHVSYYTVETDNEIFKYKIDES